MSRNKYSFLKLPQIIYDSHQKDRLDTKRKLLKPNMYSQVSN